MVMVAIPPASTLMMRAEVVARRYQRLGLVEDVKEIENALAMAREQIWAAGHKTQIEKQRIYRAIAEDLQAMLDVYDAGGSSPAPAPEPESEALTVAQIANRVGLTKEGVKYWVKVGKLQQCGTNQMGTAVYPVAEVDALMAKRQKKPRVDESAKPVDNSMPAVQPVEIIPEPIPSAKILFMAPSEVTYLPQPTTWPIKDKSIRNTFVPEPFSNGWDVA